MKKVFTAVLALAVCAVLILTRKQQPEQALDVVKVRNLSEKVEAVGMVEAERVYPISPSVTGVVRKLFVQEGSAVRKGQVIVEMEMGVEDAGKWIVELQNDSADPVKMQERLANLCMVRAPADGVVTQLAGAEGMGFAAGTALGSLSSEALCVRATVPESVRERLYEGQTASVVRGGRTYRAHIGRIAPSAQPAQMEVTLQLDSGQHTLCRGMKVEVAILITECSAPSVPLQAIAQDGTVKCRTETGTASVPVEVGLCTETYAQLLSGPPVGTSVVLGEGA